DGLPELLRRSLLEGGPAPSVRRGRDLDDTADHRPGRYALETAQGDAPRLLEHGPSPRRERGAGADVDAQPDGPGRVLAGRVGVPARRSGRRAGPLHGRSDRDEAG